jgi:hypothetical protein
VGFQEVVHLILGGKADVAWCMITLSDAQHDRAGRTSSWTIGSRMRLSRRVVGLCRGAEMIVHFGDCELDSDRREQRVGTEP